MNANVDINNKRSDYPVERQNEATVRDTVCALTSMYIANKRNKRNISYKNSVSRYNMLVLSKSYKLGEECANLIYTTGEGGHMVVTYPKYRDVKTTFYRDRMIQTSFILNYFYPEVVLHIYKNSHACIKGRGVDAARNQFKEMLRQASPSDYCLKLDITNYFGSIDHEKLINELYNYIHDDWSRWYYANVINANKNNIGIGLGSEIHQLSAVVFLNDLDKLIGNIEDSYERYMDDFIFIGSKKKCEYVLFFAKEYLSYKGLSISEKKTYIQKVDKPIKFLGFSFLRHRSGKITMKRLKDKICDEKRRLKKMKRNNTQLENVKTHYNSVRAMMKHGNRSDLMQLDRFVRSLWPEIK